MHKTIRNNKESNVNFENMGLDDLKLEKSVKVVSKKL